MRQNTINCTHYFSTFQIFFTFLMWRIFQHNLKQKNELKKYVPGLFSRNLTRLLTKACTFASSFMKCVSSSHRPMSQNNSIHESRTNNFDCIGKTFKSCYIEGNILNGLLNISSFNLEHSISKHLYSSMLFKFSILVVCGTFEHFNIYKPFNIF